MPNGLDVEKTLFERLEAAGFRLAPYHEGADQKYKVDRVILGPPPAESPFWLKPAMAAQVTLQPSHWQKIWIFKDTATPIAPRLVYLELKPDGASIDQVVQAVIAALYRLYYDHDAPKNAWIKATEDEYLLGDLDAVLAPYNKWLVTTFSEGINGRVNYWCKGELYGFAQGSIKGPSDEPEMPFFIHASQITDPNLKTLLDQFDGNISMEQQPSIIFNDAGPATDYPRKAAKNVRLATPLAAPPAPASTPT